MFPLRLRQFAASGDSKRLMFFSDETSTASTIKLMKDDNIGFSGAIMLLRNTRAEAPIMAGLSLGSVMVRKILRREAPSVLASCSHLESSLLQCSPTMTVRRGMPSMRLMAEDLRNPAIWISAI